MGTHILRGHLKTGAASFAKTSETSFAKNWVGGCLLLVPKTKQADALSEQSLFFKAENPMADTILSQIQNTVDSRRGGDPEAPYVIQLLHRGGDKILKKTIEEAGEVLTALKNGNGGHLAYEVIDL